MAGNLEHVTDLTTVPLHALVDALVDDVDHGRAYNERVVWEVVRRAAVAASPAS